MFFVFFFNGTAPTAIYSDGHTRSTHDAMPVCRIAKIVPAIVQAVRIGGAGEIAKARVQVATVRAQREVWRDPARQFYFGPVELRGRPIHGPNYTSIHALKLDVLEKIGRAHV